MDQSQLLAHCGTNKITREQLNLVPTPEGTPTHHPLAHHTIVEALLEALAFRHIATRKIWFYQLDPSRNLGKTNPLNDEDLAEFVKLQKTFADSPKSWSVDAKTIDKKNFDLSVKNPNGGEEVKHRSPQKIMDEIAALDVESAEVLGNIKTLL